MMTVLFLFIPFIMIVCGFFMYKFPPKKINGFIGYRTKRSRLNEDTWLFANRYCGKLWIMLGIIMSVLSVFAIFLFIITKTEINDTVNLIVEAVEITVMLCSIIPVEIMLKRKFGDDGNT